MSTGTPIAAMGTFWYVYLSAVVFGLGACLGSFLNVCIHRIPRGRSVITPGSHCPACQHAIAWYDNIPLVSFFVLRARCRHCGARISPRYVTVELLTGILFLLVWFKFGSPNAPRLLGLAPVAAFAYVPVYWLVVFGLLLATFVDFEHMIIPDRVSLGGIAAGLVLSAVLPGLHGAAGPWRGLAAAGLGAAVGAGTLWICGEAGRLIFRKDAMGLGDVKLLGAIGAFFGWRGVVFTVVLASFFGSIVGLTLVLAGKKQMQGRIPFGPYLALGALLWMLWGPVLWQLYLQWMTPPV